MNNSVNLIGRIKRDITSKIVEVVVNNDNFYNTDNSVVVAIKIENDEMYENVKKYCKKGDLIGIRGRIATVDGVNVMVVADKCTFLAYAKKEVE